MIELLFPSGCHLFIEDVQVQLEKIDIFAHREIMAVPCPGCQQMSSKIHSRYQRHPHDLPCFGFRVQLHLSVRRFFCHHHTCPRRTFAEPFPELVGVKKRRTCRLRLQQLVVAFAMSGEAGQRLLPLLAMPLSGDTLIREIRGKAEEDAPTPRVLGIDDWAKKRGCTYGTNLVDLESRQPVELLDTREATDVAAWLKQHPGIEIVSRDRGNEYIKVVTLGAPHVQQVADRWHLLNNLREAVETLLGQKPHVLTAAGLANEQHDDPLLPQETRMEEAPTADAQVEQVSATKNQRAAGKTPTKAEQRKAARHACK